MGLSFVSRNRPRHPKEPSANDATTATAPRGLAVELDRPDPRLRRRARARRADPRTSPGELVALLGPSGCGKTTALRILAGLDQPTSGTVEVGGKDLTRVPANKRDMGMVFQAYSLFPHMTVPTTSPSASSCAARTAAKARRGAAEMLELVGLGDHGDRYANQLSGGQQQRVALARALAIEPSVLLLDEPLSALDAKVRAQLRDEIRRVQLEVGTTTLFVTHDQEEALAVADRVGVMNAGRLEQIAPPAELYAHPATPFVAEFVGLDNRCPPRSPSGTASVLGAQRPGARRLDHVGSRPGDGAARVGLGRRRTPHGNATVVSVGFLGPISRVYADLPDGQRPLMAQIPSSPPSASPGDRVRLGVDPTPVLVIEG